ncbi:MAG: RraA family protein [Bacillota bacterium]
MTEVGLTSDLLKHLLRLGTPALSDAMDSLGGPPHGLAGLRPIGPSRQFAGIAYTVRYVPQYEPGGTVGDFIDDVPPGSVVVIDNAGRTDCTVWGGLMTRRARRLGLAGTVIDGACRDVEVAVDLQYSIWARAPFMVTGKDRVQLAAVQEPVNVCGVGVRPGDVVIGDQSGILVIPFEMLPEVVRRAERIAQAEEEIRRLIDEGVSLKEARAHVGYHHLQRKECQSQ